MEVYRMNWLRHNWFIITFMISTVGGVVTAYAQMYDRVQAIEHKIEDGVLLDSEDLKEIECELTEIKIILARLETKIDFREE